MHKERAQSPCYKTGCTGTMTYHQKLNINQDTGKVEPSGMVGQYPDLNYSGAVCDTCGEVWWENFGQWWPLKKKT